MPKTQEQEVSKGAQYIPHEDEKVFTLGQELGRLLAEKQQMRRDRVMVGSDPWHCLLDAIEKKQRELALISEQSYIKEAITFYEAGDNQGAKTVLQDRDLGGILSYLQANFSDREEILRFLRDTFPNNTDYPFRILEDINRYLGVLSQSPSSVRNEAYTDALLYLAGLCLWQCRQVSSRYLIEALKLLEKVYVFNYFRFSSYRKDDLISVMIDYPGDLVAGVSCLENPDFLYSLYTTLSCKYPFLFGPHDRVRNPNHRVREVVELLLERAAELNDGNSILALVEIYLKESEGDLDKIKKGLNYLRLLSSQSSEILCLKGKQIVNWLDTTYQVYQLPEVLDVLAIMVGQDSVAALELLIKIYQREGKVEALGEHLLPQIKRLCGVPRDQGPLNTEYGLGILQTQSFARLCGKDVRTVNAAIDLYGWLITRLGENTFYSRFTNSLRAELIQLYRDNCLMTGAIEEMKRRYQEMGRSVSGYHFKGNFPFENTVSRDLPELIVNDAYNLSALRLGFWAERRNDLYQALRSEYWDNLNVLQKSIAQETPLRKILAPSSGFVISSTFWKMTYISPIEARIRELEREKTAVKSESIPIRKQHDTPLLGSGRDLDDSQVFQL